MIVGVSGYARSGKTEAAQGLVKIGWEIKAFGDRLRDFLYTLNPEISGYTADGYFIRSCLQEVIDDYGWDGYKTTAYNAEIRRLIQTLGTDCGRNLLYPSIWVDTTLKDYGYSGKNWVIHDVRFPNEAKAIKDRGGRIIRIIKPDIGPINSHPSEIALDDYEFDYIVRNVGTVEELHDKVRFLSYLG